MIFFAQYRYGGRYTVSMLPGDGIGPEMMGYVKDIFREVGAPVDFETVELDPTTDNYDDLHNVITCQLIYFIFSSLPQGRTANIRDTAVHCRVRFSDTSLGVDL